MSIDVRGRLFVVLSTAVNYGEASGKGLRIGADLAEVKRRYGEPLFVLSDTKGVSLMYRDRGIALHVGADRRLVGWTLFTEE
jgi:hypothetical protein